MVVDLLDERRADEVFHALADTTRRDIVKRAMRGDHSVSALARCYPMSITAVQKHVSVLERAGLVTKRRCGREQLVQTEIHAIQLAERLLGQFEALWRDRLELVDEILADPTEGDTR